MSIPPPPSPAAIISISPPLCHYTIVPSYQVPPSDSFIPKGCALYSRSAFIISPEKEMKNVELGSFIERPQSYAHRNRMNASAPPSSSSSNQRATYIDLTSISSAIQQINSDENLGGNISNSAAAAVRSPRPSTTSEGTRASASNIIETVNNL